MTQERKNHKTSAPKGFMEVSSAADLLGVRPSTLHKLIRDGEIPALRLGKRDVLSQEDVDNYLLEKSREARELANRKREQSRLLSELAKKKTVDPALDWCITNCLGCGSEQLLATDAEIEAGNVFCQNCRSTGRDQSVKLTKDFWIRRAQSLAKQRTARGDRGVWLVINCVRCEKPAVISKNSLFQRESIEECSGGDPYNHVLTPSEQYSLAENYAGFEEDYYPNDVVRNLAQIELRYRRDDAISQNTELIENWRITFCSHCGEDLAVATRDERLTGATVCRACHIRNKSAPDHCIQVRIIQREVMDIMDKVYACSCGGMCDGYEVRSLRGVELSWCPYRTVAERERLAARFAENNDLLLGYSQALGISVATNSYIRSSSIRVGTYLDEIAEDDIPF